MFRTYIHTYIHTYTLSCYSGLHTFRLRNGSVHNEQRQRWQQREKQKASGFPAQKRINTRYQFLLPTCIHTYMYTCIHQYIHTSPNHPFKYTYIHTYIHQYIHTSCIKPSWDRRWTSRHTHAVPVLVFQSNFQDSASNQRDEKMKSRRHWTRLHT